MRLFRDLKDVYDFGDGRVRTVIQGIWFFLGATFVLWMIGCPWPQSGCSGGDAHAVAVIAGLIEFGIIVLLAWPRGRWFDLGFLGALVAGSLFGGGLSSAVWRLPFHRSARSAPSSSERRAVKNEWVRLHRLQKPRLVHGARLANRVEGCAEEFRAADLAGSYPRDASELSRMYDCGGLADLVVGADSARDRFTTADNAWRWSYSPGSADSSGRVASFQVRVFEDPVLGRPAPTFSGDQRGAIRETPPGGSETFAATPVPALLTLQQCLTRVPEKVARTTSRWGSLGPPLALASSVCPELRGHLPIVGEAYKDGTGALAISVDPRAGDWYDTVAVYTTEVVPVDTARGVYELLARPRQDMNGAINAGTRSFFVARDGSVHARVGQEFGDGPATADDPIAHECRARSNDCAPIVAPIAAP